jgi:hypothetical protein
VLVDGDIEMVFISTTVAIISYFIFGICFKNSGKKYSPIPYIVTLENIDF